MAKLRSVKLKSKEYVFKAFGNDREADPAKVVFSRFPQPGETFTLAGRDNLFEGVDMGNVGEKEAQKIISEKIIGNFMRNLRAGTADYRRFFEQCVDRVESFEYEGHAIVTGDDFWRILPQDAAHAIASELYGYASERDEFAMGESGA
jgi:hypothetical protein